MKYFKRAIGSFILLSAILIFPLSAFATELISEKINYDGNGNLKEGFVEINPWENNFESVDLKLFSNSGKVSSDIIYSEDKAEKVFQELQQISRIAPKGAEVLINEDNLQMKTSQISTMALKSKAQYRTEFKALALYAGTISLPTAGNYLNHSLQDKPTQRLNNIGSGHANALSLTKMYTTISTPMAASIRTANSAGKKSVGGQGSIATTVGNVGLDFYLTYGKVAYSWAANKQTNGTWLVSIAITDIYDYAKIKKISSPFPYKYIDLANNYAADAQQAGAIVKYNITNMFNQTYKP